ncbi:hypothetical protein CROQUDRAFT_665769, partial [Cronartium quercuum f. sp. fusiforme G11]
MPRSTVTPLDCPIPDMNLITYNVLSKAMKKDHGEDLTQSKVLASTNHFTQARFVFIRAMVTNWAYNCGKYPGKSQWEVIDAKLHDLCQETVHALDIMSVSWRKMDGIFPVTSPSTRCPTKPSPSQPKLECLRLSQSWMHAFQESKPWMRFCIP